MVSPRPENAQMTRTDLVPVKAWAFSLISKNRTNNNEVGHKIHPNIHQEDITRSCPFESEQCLNALSPYVFAETLRPSLAGLWSPKKDPINPSRGLSSIIYFMQEAHMVSQRSLPEMQDLYSRGECPSRKGLQGQNSLPYQATTCLRSPPVELLLQDKSLKAPFKGKYFRL